MGTFREILRIRLRHDFYQADPVPLDLAPADPAVFCAQNLLMRRQGDDILVLSCAIDLPDGLEFALIPRTTDLMMAVTIGSNWTERPVITAPIGQDDVALDLHGGTSGPQSPCHFVLALLRAVPHTDGRVITVYLNAVETYWAYHIVGTGSDSVMIDDPDGNIVFDPVGPETLPDGRDAHVFRSRTPMPFRARPTQRFSLKTPGPFGPKSVIPVLPAAGPLSVSNSTAGSSRTHGQSDIFVSIF